MDSKIHDYAYLLEDPEMVRQLLGTCLRYFLWYSITVHVPGTNRGDSRTWWWTRIWAT